MTTLGQMIGRKVHTFSTTNHAKDKVQTKVTFDFSTCSDQDICTWLLKDRTIAMQKPMRNLSKDEMEAMDGVVVLAQDCGKKVKSRSEKIAELVNLGIPENVAALAIDNPAAFAEIMEKASE